MKTPLAAYKRIKGKPAEVGINWDHIGRQYNPPIELDLDSMSTHPMRANFPDKAPIGQAQIKPIRGGTRKHTRAPQQKRKRAHK